MLNLVKERLKSFGYEFKDGDNGILAFAIEKVENTIKNDCNVCRVPKGLLNIAVDMAVGEFLRYKKTFSPEHVAGIDLNTVVKQIQAGDTSTVFAVGEGSLTDEQRLDAFLDYILNYGRAEFSCYRKIKW